jgi:DNA adenine methylase
LKGSFVTYGTKVKANDNIYGILNGQSMGFIRYPGGKQRLLRYILPYLPSSKELKGQFVEPFLGSGAVFFALRPHRALLADLNKDLIDLYRGIKNQPSRVWNIFKDFPNTKKGYYIIRGLSYNN